MIFKFRVFPENAKKCKFRVEFAYRKRCKFGWKFHPEINAKNDENLMKNDEKLMQKQTPAKWGLRNMLFSVSGWILVDFGEPWGTRISSKIAPGPKTARWHLTFGWFFWIWKTILTPDTSRGGFLPSKPLKLMTVVGIHDAASFSALNLQNHQNWWQL